MTIRDVYTPLGILRLAEESKKLTRAEFAQNDMRFKDDTPLLLEAQRQLDAYFDGRLEEFSLPVLISGTPFEQSVMHALLEVPYGQTRTYGQIAARIGRPKASRAVGRACSKNRLLLFIPCHRIIAANGSLTGFAAGVERKRALLRLESREQKTE